MPLVGKVALLWLVLAVSSTCGVTIGRGEGSVVSEELGRKHVVPEKKENLGRGKKT